MSNALDTLNDQGFVILKGAMDKAWLQDARDVARELPERARQLLGYSIHPPFMGQVAGRHPQKYLDDSLPEWPKA
ncbi:MAG: hypothetical protein ACPG06_03440 [Alphaproteobacteria bacterium]